MNTLRRLEKITNCPLCRSGWATIKYTKTNHLMLRCDECKLLIFANSLDSEDELLKICRNPELDTDLDLMNGF